MKILLITLLFYAGCQPVLHVTENHCYYVPAGIELQTVHHGTITTEHPGAWFSEWYMEQLWEIKKEQARE